MSDSGYEESVQKLDARGYGIKPDLSRIEVLVEMLDHPERNYPCIQVAGTNGKSSTARMIGDLLAAHGLKCGLYLSPHLQSPRERFLLTGPAENGIASELISKREFVEVFEYLVPFVLAVEAERGEVTYHEVTTAMALEWFSDKAVAAAILETGMGGTWDAANVATAEVAVLTEIDVDHVEFLGSTPVENASEKVGIIDQGAKVISANQAPEVNALVEKTSSGLDAELFALGKKFSLKSNEPAVGGRLIAIGGIYDDYDDIYVSLLGSHQGANAAVAIAASEAFMGRELDRQAIDASLGEVVSPGRLEIVRRTPLVVLDGAHNPSGARALAASLEEAFGERRITLVLSIFRDKDKEGILQALLPISGSTYFASSGHPRSSDPEDLVRLAKVMGYDSYASHSMIEAIEAAILDAGANGLVLIAGSLWAVGVARDHLMGSLD